MSVEIGNSISKNSLNNPHIERLGDRLGIDTPFGAEQLGACLQVIRHGTVGAHTIDQFALQMGVDPVTYGRIESGKAPMPTQEVLLKWCRNLGLGREDETDLILAAGMTPILTPEYEQISYNHWGIT